MEKVNGKAVVRPNALYFVELTGRCLEHPGQRTKMLEKGPGLILTVLAGCAENKQKFHYLCVGECFYAVLIKFIL